MQMKSRLRKQLREKRINIENKADTDEKIAENLSCSDLYLNAELVLLYAALDDEINIDSCIEDALRLGKKVALPACLDDKGNMNFYYINSSDDLISGYFSLREPDVNTAQPVTDFHNSVCIVPGIAFDKSGGRLGYGKGYYDRFLENFSGISIGLCYNMLIEDMLPLEEYDIRVDYIVTEINVYKTDCNESIYLGGKENG